MKRLVLAVIAACTLLSACGVASKSETETVDHALLKGLKERSFIMYARAMHPLGMASKVLDGTDYVKVSGDNLSSELPYFGRTTMAPIGGEAGLCFAGDVRKYVRTREKDYIRVYLETDYAGDRLRYTFEIYPDGTASLTVTSNYKDTIRYDGDARALNE